MSDTGTSRFANLFSPGGIGDVALGNRAVVAPMTRISAGPGGLATDEMATYYAEYARGGFGLVITEGTYIDQAHSQGYVDQPGIANDAQRDSWRRVVDAVHAEGVPIFMQLLHAGALIQHNDYVGEAVAPSAVEPVGEMAPHYKGDGKFPIPREITRRGNEGHRRRGSAPLPSGRSTPVSTAWRSMARMDISPISSSPITPMRAMTSTAVRRREGCAITPKSSPP